LLDIFFGLIIIGWITNSLGDFFDTVIVIIILSSYYILVCILFILTKRFISVPRMGQVKFGPIRKLNVKRFIIFSVINTTILIILLILPYTGLFQSVNFDGYITILLICTLFIWLPLSIIAFLIKFNRLYIYAIIGGLSFFVADLLRGYIPYLLSTSIVFGVSGGIIFSIGLIVFLRFLKKYPKEGGT
jgi:hypothetical protein